MNVYRVQATIKGGGGCVPDDGLPGGGYFKNLYLDQIITCPTAADAKLIMQTAYPQAKVDKPVLLLKLK